MLVGGKSRLRPKLAKDAWQDYQWRQDPELADLDATIPLDESFDEYQRGYIWELEHPARHRRRFAIETLDGRHIGNVAYFDIDQRAKEAQVGIMVGDRDYWGRGYGTEAVGLVLDYVFSDGGMESIYLRTLDWNLRAQGSFRKCGFVPAGKLSEGRHNFIIMKVTRAEWKAIRERESNCAVKEEA